MIIYSCRIITSTDTRFLFSQERLERERERKKKKKKVSLFLSFVSSFRLVIRLLKESGHLFLDLQKN